MRTGESPHTPTRVWEPRSKPGARPGPHTHRGMEYEVGKPCQGSGLLRVSGNLRVTNSLPESSGENRSWREAHRPRRIQENAKPMSR